MINPHVALKDAITDNLTAVMRFVLAVVKWGDNRDLLNELAVSDALRDLPGAVKAAAREVLARR